MNSHRGLLIAGNWKMNHGPNETGRFFSELARLVTTALSPDQKSALDSGQIQIALFPPSVSLTSALESKSQVPLKIEIGAQTVHWEMQGAFTGEISAPMVRQLGVNWALVGHSERRQYFGETNATALKRTQSLLKQEFHVIACIGENLEERKANRTQEVIAEQFLNSIPMDAGPQALSKQLIIAYEPVWAIGTGLTPTAEEIEASHRFLRELIEKRWGSNTAQSTLLLYGGSVTPQNTASILACSHVDGVLVGGASVKPESFFALLQGAAQAVSAQ